MRLYGTWQICSQPSDRTFGKKELLTKEPSLTDRRSYHLSITERGQKALEETYNYYLSPIYTMRRRLGEAQFLKLMELIHETNDVLQDIEH